MTVTWTFCAADEANVQCPRALDQGVARILGKRYDAATDSYVHDAPTAYALSKRNAAQLRAFFAKNLKAGHLAPADKLTADAFGLPFKEST